MSDDLPWDDDFTARFLQDGEALSNKEEPPGRHPVLTVAVMVFSAVLMWMFAEEARYSMLPPEPIELGDTAQYRDASRKNPAHRPPEFVHNQFVRVSGLTTLRTESAKSNQAFLKLTFVPVYVHLKNEQPSRASGQLVHLTVTGRLLDMSRTHNYRSIQHFYAKSFDLPTARAFMVVAGDKPKSFWWAVPLECLFMAFIFLNGRRLWRQFGGGVA